MKPESKSAIESPSAAETVRRENELQQQEARINQLCRKLQLPRPPLAPGETRNLDSEEQILLHLVGVEEYLASPPSGERHAGDT